MIQHLKKKLKKQQKKGAQKKQQSTQQGKGKGKGKDKDKRKEEQAGAAVVQDENEFANEEDIRDGSKRIKEFVRDIHIHNLSVPPIGGGAPLIRGSDVKLIHGHRYGLIGYNGGMCHLCVSLFFFFCSKQ